MYYEINVSHKDAGHLFATHLRPQENASENDLYHLERDANNLFDLLAKKFQRPIYRVQMLKHEETGLCVSDTAKD